MQCSLNRSNRRCVGACSAFIEPAIRSGQSSGPLAGVALLSYLPHTPPDLPFRRIFLLSLVPGLMAPVIFALIVRESRASAEADHETDFCNPSAASRIPPVPAGGRTLRKR